MGQVGHSSASPLQSSSRPCLGLTDLRLVLESRAVQAELPGPGPGDEAMALHSWEGSQAEVNDTLRLGRGALGVLLEAQEGPGSIA